MAEDQRAAAPQITISDPCHPGELVDVLGSADEREPWRPSRRQVTVTAVVLLVLGVTVVPAAVLKHRSEERAAERKALAQLDLHATEPYQDGGYGEELPRLVVTNQGPDAVHIVGVRVDREGYRHQRADVTINAHDVGALTIALEPTCPTNRPSFGPGGLLLDVETPHSGKTTVRVRTASSRWAFEYLFAQQQKCRLFQVEDSLDSELGEFRLKAGSFTAAVRVTNQALRDRTLTAITAPEGFAVSVSPQLPLVLAGGDRANLTLMFTVTDCAGARRALTPETGDGGIGQLPADVPTFRSDVLYAISGDGRVLKNLTLLQDPDVGSALAELTAQACPS